MNKIHSLQFHPKNGTKKYDDLFSEIDTGKIKIPKFQREFVWSKTETAKLIDSILRGFPIGTFILWKTRDELRHYKDIGNATLPKTLKGDPAYYILDGQQRITSLYAVKKGLIITKDGKEIDYKGIFINLSASIKDEDLVTVEKVEGGEFISVHDLLNQGIKYFVSNFPEELIDSIDDYKKKLTTYDFSTIEILDYPLEIACDIFTRINTAGQELTLFEIMVAKTYDHRTNFDLAEKYEELMQGTNGSKCLNDAGYNSVPPSTILQCISICLTGQAKRKEILKIKKQKIIKNWDMISDGIMHAVDYFRSHMRIPVSMLLPYHALLVPATYFFVKNGGKKPSAQQDKLIQQYFWWASLSNRFSSAVESKLAVDAKRIDKIIKNEHPKYKGEEVELSEESIRWRWFSAGDAFCKAILCLYAYHEPKSFDAHARVMLGNSWLKIASSKNYHHFFPKSYLRKKGYKDVEANTVVNITMVDDYLNKNKIRANSPSKYIAEYAKENDKIDATLRTHLIGDKQTWGVMDDDYERFINKRTKKIVKELNVRLHPQLAG